MQATDLLTYPDVTIVCGPLERDRDDPLAAVKPTLLVEVLSDSRERYNRGVKFEHYKRLSSLRQYVLVSHRERRVEVWTREAGDVWACTAATDGEQASLDSIAASLDVRELYDEATATRE